MATQPIPETRPDFQHDLAILPPIADAGGTVLWFAYIDEPTKWHRSFPAPANLLLAAGELLRRILEYERNPSVVRRNPNCIAGPIAAIPNIKPRWIVRVAADCSEADPEWAVELQDDSAWGASSYDLRELLARLGDRITAVDIPPQPLLSTMPARAEPGKIAPTVQPSGFATAGRSELAMVEREIANHEKAIADRQAEIAALIIRRRALKAALAAYEKHMRPAKGGK